VPLLTVNYQLGCHMADNDTSGIAAAANAAAMAEVAVVVLGLDQSQEAEGLDRYSIALPGVQLQLIQAVLAAQPKTVLVLVAGGSVDITWAQANVPAIVHSYYPGEEGGNAIADVLFGLYSPSGRLPITLYPAAFTEQISMFSMDMREPPGKTYRFYSQEPVYPFGYGLSYTSFTYMVTPADASTAEAVTNEEGLPTFGPDDTIAYNVTVTNTGTTVSDVSVLGFLGMVGTADEDCPISQLFDFKKINLWVEASHTLMFRFNMFAAGCVDTQGNPVVKSGTWGLTLGDTTVQFIVSGSKTGSKRRT